MREWQVRRHSLKMFCIFLTCIITASCSDDKFKKYVALEDLRILGLIAEDTVNVPGDGTQYAETLPGTALRITPWISDVNETTNLQYEWQACIDPGLNYGAEPSCSGNPTATSITSGYITTQNLASTFTGAGDSFLITAPVAILAGRSASEQFNGVNYLVIYSILNSAGKKVTAVKRVPISGATKAEKNKNPVIANVSANGSPLGVLASGLDYLLSITYSATSNESYQIKNSDGSTSVETEELQTTWFYSDGSMKFFRTINLDTNTYSAPATYPTGRSSFLIAVSRDPRGGIAIQKTIINP